MLDKSLVPSGLGYVDVEDSVDADFLDFDEVLVKFLMSSY